MLKISLNYDQRKMFGEKLLDVGHLIFGGCVISQLFSDRPFSISIAVTGLILLVFLYWVSYTVTKRRRK